MNLRPKEGTERKPRTQVVFCLVDTKESVAEIGVRW